MPKIHLTSKLLSMLFMATSIFGCMTRKYNETVMIYKGQLDVKTVTSSVAIFKLDPSKIPDRLCTATKIAKNLILTAAHCVMSFKGGKSLPTSSVFNPAFEKGSTIHLAAGPDIQTDIRTGSVQALKVIAVYLFPGMLNYIINCAKNCLNPYYYAVPFPSDLKVHFPDLAIVEFDAEIQHATIASIGTAELAKALVFSGYGMNISQHEKNKGIVYVPSGNKRFFNYSPINFQTLKDKAAKSLGDDKLLAIGKISFQSMTPSTAPLYIFTQFREPLTAGEIALIKENKNNYLEADHSPELKWNAALEKGDSGGGSFLKIDDQYVLVAVASAGEVEAIGAQSDYFSVHTAITKNPLRNTYDWIQKIIAERGMQ